ncbi:MAG TPA: hypothetical protein VH723_09255, partial [Candidatus Limnocylindrales bacterium]
VVEGRARDAIWREGRWWDEISMSVLEPEWVAARRARDRTVRAPAAAPRSQPKARTAAARR